MLLVGIFQVAVTPTEVGTSGSFRYEDVGAHVFSTSLMIDGIVGRNRAALLLINGKQLIERLPITIRVVPGEASRWANPKDHQTKTAAGDGLRGDNEVAESLGQFFFLPALEDKELRIKEPDRLWVDLRVPESVFSDLRNGIRAGNDLKQVGFHVYGSAMQIAPSYTNTVFHWQFGKGESGPPLDIVNFGYAFGRAILPTQA